MNHEENTDESNDIDLWMIRPCDLYKSEYNECTSIVSRLHQMFIHGVTTDCNNWQEDYINCMKWKNEKELKAAKSLIQAEKKRRFDRWKSFYANNVWETRKSPPENWNDPLPDYIQQRRPNSTFKDTLDEYNEQNDNNKSFCSVM